jgi:hypothetical protein
MDDVLPLPTPDWDNPQPVDAPEPEEVDALAALVDLRDRLTRWLPLAATTSLPPVQWRDIVAALNRATTIAAAADTDPVAHYTPARIDIYPHPSVPLAGQCARCHRDLDDEAHPL